MHLRTLPKTLAMLGLAALLPVQGCTPEKPPATAVQAAPDTARIERTIEESPLLAALQERMARLLVQAQAGASDKQALQAAQQAWLARRDAGCHDKPASRDAPEAGINNCLRIAFEQRIAELVDQAWPPLRPVAVREIPASLVRQFLAPSDCRPAQAAFADAGPGQARALALEVDCGDAERRVWLIDASGQRLTPATPELGAGDANSELLYRTGTELLWQGDTLFVATTMETMIPETGDPYWDARYFRTASGGAPIALDQLPDALQRRQDHPPGIYDGDAHAFTGMDGLFDESVRVVGNSLVWAAADGEDDAILYARPLAGHGQAREIARGPVGWLGYILFDARRLLYADEAGLLLHLPDSHATRRIAGTGLHHLPLAWDPATRQLAWFGEVPCDGGRPTEQAHLCIATLPEDMP